MFGWELQHLFFLQKIDIFSIIRGERARMSVLSSKETKKIHDCRVQRVTDIPYFNNGAYG